MCYREKRDRKNYTDDFKREAVKLLNQQGYRISETARNLGIHESVLKEWVKVESSSEYNSGSQDNLHEELSVWNVRVSGCVWSGKS